MKGLGFYQGLEKEGLFDQPLATLPLSRVSDKNPRPVLYGRKHNALSGAMEREETKHHLLLLLPSLVLLVTAVREDGVFPIFPILVPGEPEIKGPEGPEQVLLRREQP